MDYSSSNGNQANGNDDEEEDLENLVRHCVRDINTERYYTNRSVLLENAPLVKFVRDYICNIAPDEG